MSVLTGDIGMASMRRGVGYCMNEGGILAEGCEDFAKGVFLLNHGKTFYCPRCRHQGLVLEEAGSVDRRIGEPFKEVRVEYNYDPLTKTFREIAIVRDEAIPSVGSSYVLKSPLIKTEKRALKVAESILANLQRYDFIATDDIPRATEILISFDEDYGTLAKKLKCLGDEWEKSSLAVPKEEKPEPIPMD